MLIVAHVDSRFPSLRSTVGGLSGQASSTPPRPHFSSQRGAIGSVLTNKIGCTGRPEGCDFYCEVDTCPSRVGAGQLRCFHVPLTSATNTVSDPGIVQAASKWRLLANGCPPASRYAFTSLFCNSVPTKAAVRLPGPLHPLADLHLDDDVFVRPGLWREFCSCFKIG